MDEHTDKAYHECMRTAKIEAEERLKAAEAHIRKLEIEWNELRGDLDEWRTRCRAWEAKAKELENNRDDWKNEVHHLGRHIRDLQKALGVACSQRDAAEAKRDEIEIAARRRKRADQMGLIGLRHNENSSQIYNHSND